MKKYSMIFLLLLTFTLTSCTTTPKNSMSLKPSQLSKETNEILDLFDDNIYFYDLSVNDKVKSITIQLWIYQENQWVESGNISGDLNYKEGRIAIRITENSFELITIDKDGHSKYSTPSLDTDFKDSISTLATALSNEIPLELNKETTIFVKTGTDKNTIEPTNNMDDFRDSDCNTGIAITVTVSDKILE